MKRSTPEGFQGWKSPSERATDGHETDSRPFALRRSTLASGTVQFPQPFFVKALQKPFESLGRELVIRWTSR
jgi:hypothetical protein